MKLRSLRYLTGEGIKSVWVNRLMSIASVGVLTACMLLIGIAIALSYNIDLALGNLEQQNVVMVYFNDETAVQYDGTAVSNSSTSASGTSSSSSRSSSSSSKSSSKSSSSSKASSGSSSTASGSAEVSSGVSDEGTSSVNRDSNGERIVTQEEAEALCTDIAEIPNVASVEFISSEEGLSRMIDEMDQTQADYFTWLQEDNPLSNGAKVTMTDLSQFDETIASIEAVDGVRNVYQQRDLAMKITSIKNGIGVAGIWIIALLLVIALVIVSNTIRVTMYNRKLEISIMKAVGATNAFIRTPFVIEGALIGLISAGLSFGMLYFVYRAVMNTMKEALSLAQVVPFRSFALPVFGLFAGIGVVAGLLGSSIMISKYLRKEGSEFRAL